MNETNSYLVQAIPSIGKHPEAGPVAISGNEALRLERITATYGVIPIYCLMLADSNRVIRHILTGPVDWAISEANEIIRAWQTEQVQFDQLPSEPLPILDDLDFCPFCGGRAFLTNIDLDERDCEAQIQCRKCRVTTRLCRHARLTETIRQAVNAWQRRLPEVPADQIAVMVRQDGRLAVMPCSLGRPKRLKVVDKTDLIDHLQQWPELPILVSRETEWLIDMLRTAGRDVRSE